MNVLVLGSRGMLGHVVRLYLQGKGYTVAGTSRSGAGTEYLFDVMRNIKSLETIVDEFKPVVVVNCIGVLNKAADENKPLAVMANSYLPHYVDGLCSARSIKFIHVSTDCVFEGTVGGYTEDSFRDATSFYGRSKALGEVEDSNGVTLRTSIVGPDTNKDGTGLFQWFMSQSGRVNGFDKVVWTGVTTLELAKAIEKSIENNLSGLRHVVNNSTINKYDLLNLFRKCFHKDIEVERKSDHVSDKSLIRMTDFNFQVPSYEQMIEEMSSWVNEHSELYPINQRVM